MNDRNNGSFVEIYQDQEAFRSHYTQKLCEIKENRLHVSVCSPVRDFLEVPSSSAVILSM